MEEERNEGEKKVEVKGDGWGVCCGWGHGKHRDRLDAVGWAAVLIWAAIVILMETTGAAADIIWWEAWPVFFIGLGVIALVGALARLALPARRKSVISGLVLALIFLGIGFSSLYGWGWGWVLPAILIVIAISVLVRVFTRRH